MDRRRVADVRRGVASVFAAVGVLVALIIAVHVLFVVFDANAGNDVVTFFREASGFLDGAFTDLFRPDTHDKQVAVNDGLAAASYLLVGLGGARLIRG